MAKVIAFTVEVNGIQRAIQNQEDLKKAVSDVKKTFETADFGTEQYKRAEKELVKLQADQKNLKDETRKTAQEFEVAADKGQGSYRAINAELKKLRGEFRELGAAERDAFGPELISQIQKLDKELKGIDANLGQFGRNVGNYESAFSALGGIDLASLLTVPGAIAATGAAFASAGQYIGEFADEFVKLRGEISTLTGATGEDLDRFTSNIAAIADTFQAETGDITQAANAVSKQLGISFDDALSKIEEGFIAGSNANGEFLDTAREYPAFFKEAGLSADQFFSVINQSAKQGIFSDKGIDVVKEVTLRLRELPQATQDALSGIGLSAEEIKKQIGEEGIGSAIATVTKRLGELKSDSPEVGRAIADIFGGPGEDAGLQFLISLQNIDKETGSLIDITNEYQGQQERLLQVNKQFTKIQNDLAKEIAGVKTDLKILGTEVLTKVLAGFLAFFNVLKAIPAFIRENRIEIGTLATAILILNARQIAASSSALLLAAKQTIATAATIAYAGAQAILNIALTANPVGIVVTALGGLVILFTQAYKRSEQFRKTLNGLATAAAAFFGIDIGGKAKDNAKGLDTANASTNKRAQSVVNASDKEKEYADEIDNTSESLKDFDKNLKTSAVAADQFAKGSIAALRKEVQDLQKRFEEVSPEQAPGILQKLLKAEDALKDAEDFQSKLRAIATRSVKDIEDIKRLGSVQIASEVASESGAVENAKQEATDIQAIRKTSEKRRLEIIKETSQRILDEQQIFVERFAEIQQLIFSSIGTAIQSLSDTSASISDAQIADLEKRYNKEIELAEGNTEKQERLAEELSTKKQEFEKEEFETQKKYRVAAAFASLAEGIVNILSAPTTIPDPFGTLFKAVRIGFLTATTTAQISAINRQRADKGIILENAAKGNIIGGKVRGATHQDKSHGVPVNVNGKQVLVENGEWFDVDEYGGVSVMNKRSTAIFEDQLKAMLGKVFQGKRALLSGMNNYKNYGVPYLSTGAVIKPNIDSVIYRNATGPAGQVQIVAIDPNSIEDMAAQNKAAVESGTERGIVLGLNRANRIAERDKQVNKRLGK